MIVKSLGKIYITSGYLFNARTQSTSTNRMRKFYKITINTIRPQKFTSLKLESLIIL